MGRKAEQVLNERIWPDGVVGGAQVDEEVPGPVGHFEEVVHAAQVHRQETGSAPNGRHPPGRHSDVGEPARQRQNLLMEVIGPLRWTEPTKTELNFIKVD